MVAIFWDLWAIIIFIRPTFLKIPKGINAISITVHVGLQQVFSYKVIWLGMGLKLFEYKFKLTSLHTLDQ